MMNRNNIAAAVTAVLMVAPTMASALGISIVNVSSTGSSTTTLLAGEQITFDLRLENPTNVDVYGLDIVVTGYDTPGTLPINSSGLELVGGTVATSALNTVNVPAVGSLGGIANVRTAPTQVWVQNLANPQPIRTSLFASVALAPSNGNGSQDIGVDGGLVGSGDVHFRVTYQLITSNPNLNQNLVLSFGVAESLGHVAVGAGGETIAFQNATHALTVIPEPGTALLMGLGLAALATRRR